VEFPAVCAAGKKKLRVRRVCHRPLAELKKNCL